MDKPGTEINESTADVAEPIVTPGGHGVTSFDDLEQLHEQIPSAKEEKAPKKEKSEAPAKAEPKKKEAPKKAGKEDEEHGEESDEGEKGDEKRPEKQEEVSQAKVKTHKVRSGDTDVELRADTPFEVNIAGKAEKVPLQDLLNNYSGKVVWEKKFSELDHERKSFHSERDGLQSSVDKLFDLAVKQNKPREAIEFLAEAMGANPLQVWESLETQIMSALEEMKDLSPEERKARKIERENEFFRRRESEKVAADQERKLRESVEKRTKTIQETHKLSDEQFYRIYQELKNSGQVKPEELTPELVGDYYAEVTTRQELGKILDEASPELQNRDKELASLRQIMVQNQFSIEDMRDVIAEVYGSKKSKGLAKKLKQSQPADTARVSKERKREPLTFDDIDG